MAARTHIHGKNLLRVQAEGQQKNLLVLRGAGSTPLFEAHLRVEEFNSEHGTNLRVVSHKVADAALTGGQINGDIRFPVDAAIAYSEPLFQLGSLLWCHFDAHNGPPKVSLATGRYKNERYAALVALGLSSADFIKDGDSFVLGIPDERLILVPNFARRDGWYLPHEGTGVPQGETVHQSTDARYLVRFDDPLFLGYTYVGLLVRGVVRGKYRREIDATWGPHHRAGVVAEVPEADVGKIRELLNK
jgi:hypothetical protein